jgi:predicted dehydrogenase
MASEKPVRWGILGVAKINERMLPAFAQMANGRLTAIASRSADRAAEAARSAGLPKSYASYPALLDDSDIDAVYIPLPNAAHAEWTRQAADRGKHVLCEKPLSPTAGDAQSMVDHCRARNVRLMDGFMWPHHPRTAQIKQLIQSGRIGRVDHAHGTFSFPLPLDASNIRLQPARGGGSLLDVGCYPVFGFRWAFGEEPVRAFATARFEFGVDLSMAGTLWFPGDRTATFDCAFTRPLRQHFEIVGTDGVICVPRMWLPEPDAEYWVNDERRHCPCESQIVSMLDNFNAAVLEGRDPAPPAAEAVRTLRVLDALTRSAREGCPIDIL